MAGIALAGNTRKGAAGDKIMVMFGVTYMKKRLLFRLQQ